MKIHLPCALRRILLSLLLPITGILLSHAESTSFENQENILFKNYTNPNRGGAIFADLAPVTFRNNGNVSFEENSISTWDTPDENLIGQGGAIFTWGEVIFSGNNRVVFIENSSQEAGAIYASRLNMSQTRLMEEHSTFFILAPHSISISPTIHLSYLKIIQRQAVAELFIYMG